MNKRIKKVLKHIFTKVVLILIKIVFILLKPFHCFLVFIEDAIRYAIWKNRSASLEENTKIYPYVIIHSAENVKIGSNVSIAEFVHIWGAGEGGDRK